MENNNLNNCPENQLLENRAHEIEEWAEEHFIDSNGVVYSDINKDPEKALDSSCFDTPLASILPDCPPEDFWSYENCGMSTGAYLNAMVFRYRVENDSQALLRARRCFKALKYIYEIGKEYEEGFFPKIYGNKFSTHTSSDQVLYCLMALDQYFPLAENGEQAQISHMICVMVRFWVKRDYKFTFFNKKDMSWPLLRFPALLLMAYKHSNDEFFKKEYDRLLDLGVTDKPEFDRLNLKKSGKLTTGPCEEKAGAWLLNSTPDLFAMDVMQFDYKLRNDPGNERATKWRAGIALMWDEAKIMLAPDGKSWFCVLVDMKTGEAMRPGERLDEVDLPEYYHGLIEAKWGRGTISARGAVQASYFFPENTEMISSAKHILSSMAKKDLVDMENPEIPEKINPTQRCRNSFFCGDSMANWLWAYWQGRWQKLW